MAIFAFKTDDQPIENTTSKFSSSAAGENSRSMRPVDLVHLSRQSLGDQSLEMEILSLFRVQTALYMERLENASNLKDRKMAAHTILGSARGIGAWQVAEAAEFIQNAGCQNVDLTSLKFAVEAAKEFIDTVLEDS